MTTIVIQDVASTQDLADVISHLTQLLATGEFAALPPGGTLTVNFGFLEGPSTTLPVPSVAELEEAVDRFGDDECFELLHRDGCTCQWDASSTDPRQGTFCNPPRISGAVRFAPCPERGTHARAEECWRCWNDFFWDNATLEEIVAPQVVEGTR